MSVIWLERTSFAISVSSALVAAVAGGVGAIEVAIGAGCVAAVSPIISRILANRSFSADRTRLETQIFESDEIARTAQADLAALKNRLQARRLSPHQKSTIAQTLSSGIIFPIRVNHNRHEAEPAAFSDDLRDALTMATFAPGWFGGMTNSTVGIEVSGTQSEEKSRLLLALSNAEIDHLNVTFSDDPEGRRGIEIWVGVHPHR